MGPVCVPTRTAGSQTNTWQALCAGGQLSGTPWVDTLGVLWVMGKGGL